VPPNLRASVGKVEINLNLRGALGSAVITVGQVAFDPSVGNTFGVNVPWLTVLGTLLTVIVVGAVTAYFTQVGWEKAGLIPVGHRLSVADFKQPAIIAVPLIIAASLMVASGATFFRRDGTPFPPLATLLRGDRPEISTELKLAGLNFIGPRDDVVKRGTVKRDRMEYRIENKGTPDEVSLGTTVYDDFEEWELYDANSAGRITVTADASVLQVTLECEPGLNSGEEFCSDENYPRREALEVTFKIAYHEDAFLRSINTPDSALAIRFDNREASVDDKRKRARLYCRLNLVNVTPAKFSVIQIIPCEADWVVSAKQLRERLESQFVSMPVIEKPAP
jgi:hypothetical protein